MLISGVNIRILAVFFFCTILPGLNNTVVGQANNVDFGQRRVQYHDFTWSYYGSNHFTTYFYLGGQDIGKFVIQYAEEVVEEIENILEYRLMNNIEIMVYNDLTDFNMTNIGADISQENTGGVTKIIENKMFIYFNGNHKDLEKQIRMGIATVFLNNMMFGGNIQEIIQNAVLLNLPDWFTKGLISYIGEPWNTDLDNKLRDGILNGKFKKFSNLRDDDARFAGHSIWHYVREKYGTSAVANLLYLTRINRSLESGFLFVLGAPVSHVLEDWYNYYFDIFSKERDIKDFPGEELLVNKKKFQGRDHFQAKVNPDGKHIAYATNDIGQKKVYVLDNERHRSKKILKFGMKTIFIDHDEDYPLLAWSANGEVLAVVYEKRDKIKLLLYDMNTRKKVVKPITKFQKVNHIAFTDDPRTLVMSANNIGQSDIFTYFIPSTRLNQITNDFYDDLQPAFVKMQGKRGVIFASNRESDTLKTQRIDTVLPLNNFDLFFYDLNKENSELIRITETEHSNESHPVQLNDTLFSFLSDENGIRNQYAGYFDSLLHHYDKLVFFKDSTIMNPLVNVDSILRIPSQKVIDSVWRFPIHLGNAHTYPISDFSSSLIEHDISNGLALDHFQVDGLHKFYLKQIDTLSSEEMAPILENTSYRNYYLDHIANQEKSDKGADAPKKENDQIKSEENNPEASEEEEAEGFYFQNEFNVFPEAYYIDSADLSFLQATDEPIYKLSKTLPYKVKFSTEYVLTQLDNSLLFTGYQKYSSADPSFQNPDLNAFISLGISDLMEDYKIRAGFRFPTNFKGSEYFLTYEAKRKRLDKQLTYYRKKQNRTFTDEIPFLGIDLPQAVPSQPVVQSVEAKEKTNLLQLNLTYPLDVVRSFRLTTSFRHDNYVFLSKDKISLELPNYAESWVMAKLEYVHDHTIPLGTNIRTGLRFNVWGEIHKQIPFNDKEIRGAEIKLPGVNENYMTVVGLDFRYYQQIHRQMIWANRVSFGTSLGTRRLLYYLGGVDNWMPARFDNSIPTPTDERFAYQALATNLRGFDQNVRNGNTHLLINSEIRVPVFSYLVNSPIRSEFIKNFQLVAFTDVGTAWSGKNPYDQNNPLFTDIIDDKEPIEIEVNYFRNPIVTGYGWGARTILFGYFIRVDVAWGRDSGEKVGPSLYFSLSLDF